MIQSVGGLVRGILRPRGSDRSEAVISAASTWPKVVAWGAVALSLALGLVLLLLHRNLGGPGDPLGYYRQAAQLIPFQDHFYGPGYMVVIRALHDLLNVEWFTAGKLASWLSTFVIVGATYWILDRTLGKPVSWLALALFAINPLLITMSYTTWMHTVGTATVLVAVASTVNVSLAHPGRWIVPGLLFGLAALTRFQALGFLLGAIAGGMLVTQVRFVKRLASMGVLLGASLAPVMAWNAFLLMKQGFLPENHNFIALTIPLGRYETFFEMEDLVTTYGSTWGVLTSSWSAPFRIFAHGLREFVFAPRDVGVPLVWVGALLLVPGLPIALLKREWRAPWLFAFLAGLFLTGLAGRGWMHYYLPFVPFAIVLIAVTLQTLDRYTVAWVPRLAWLGLFLVTIAWAPGMVRDGFEHADWAEQTEAKRYLEAQEIRSMVVASSASSFPYDTEIPYVDQSVIMDPDETDRLVPRLREHGVTHLVITERHTLWEYPDLEYLLADSVPDLPAGLVRDTLFVHPYRLAIYRVESPDQQSPGGSR